MYKWWWPCDGGASNLVVDASFLFNFRVFVVFRLGPFELLYCIYFFLLG